MVQPHHTTDSVTPTATPLLRPYEFIARPPIAFVLDAIVDNCGLGGSITPGVRSLAEWAGVSAGQITPILRQLADDGWILYDGRVITLVRHPDQADDQLSPDEIDLGADHEDDLTPDRTDLAADRFDQAKDRPDLGKDRFGVQSGANGTGMRRTAPNRSDLAKDRFRGHMVHVSLQQQQSLDQDPAAATKRHVPCAADFDQAPDRPNPAAQLLAELGVNKKLIARGLAKRPDLTAQEVQTTWAHFQARERGGRVRDALAAFSEAIADGQIYSAPPDPERPIDPAAYAGDDQFRAGGDVSDLEQAEETPHERAGRIAPDDASGLEFVFLVRELASGATDEEALAALEERRASVPGASVRMRPDRTGVRFAGGHGR